MSDTDIKLDKYREVLHSSKLFSELKECLDKFRIVKIRCLALGSFSEEFPAKYQLSLLLEILDCIGTNVKVSIYDPAFNDKDEKYIAHKHWQIVETEEHVDSTDGVTLFYMPHAPLDLTEEVIKREKPQLILGNELSQHTDRYTERQLYEKYPVLSKLVYNSKHYNRVSISEDDKDGFVKQESRKSRRRKNKWCLNGSSIDYSSVESYFNDGVNLITNFRSADIDAIKEGQEQWNHSFSDLALFEIK
ncbi:hypothetical protein RNJ44_03212 [Nakaseomyces bracarensis]|uniref:SRR1-like domain-containing protein n=1 Tax=Nakaseomyces bracarensis TaxID=273131 RepID=A0ABR4NZN9_9SACH